MPLLVAAIIYLLIEGYVMFLVAEHIGFLATFGLFVVSAVAGSYLLRSQGMDAFSRTNAALMRGVSPQVQLLEGVLLFFAGMVFIVPGFVSDILVLPLLLPPFRTRIAKMMLRRFGKTGYIKQSEQYEYYNSYYPIQGLLQHLRQKQY